MDDPGAESPGERRRLRLGYTVKHRSASRGFGKSIAHSRFFMSGFRPESGCTGHERHFPATAGAMPASAWAWDARHAHADVGMAANSISTRNTTMNPLARWFGRPAPTAPIRRRRRLEVET